MKVLSAAQTPLQPAAAPGLHDHKLALVGGAFGLFALGALATALVLEGPEKPGAAAVPAAAATAAAKAAKKNGAPARQDKLPQSRTPL